MKNQKNQSCLYVLINGDGIAFGFMKHKNAITPNLD
jgi:hypothetical protein